MQAQVHLQDPPQHEYVLQATFPSREAGPWSVEGFPTDWRLVVPENQDGISVFEVSARVPAGTSSATLRRESHPGPGVPIAQYAFQPSTLSLQIDGQTFPLTTRAAFVGRHRRGRVHTTLTFHRALGAFGHAEYWIDARAGETQLDVCLLWHRAAPGPDIRFDAAQLVVPDGASCVNAIEDPGLSGTTITPGVIPQQHARVFRFSIVPTGAQPEPAHVGTGNWREGGFLYAGLPVPFMQNSTAAELADARWRLAQNAPSPSWGDVPATPLWPADGVHTGGAGGGDDRVPLDGMRWAASRGDSSAYERYLIMQLRGLSRARIRLDPDGTPIDIPAVPGWSFWDDFLPSGSAPGGKADAPWEWDRWSTVGSPWAQHDMASMVRALNENWALVWLANEPLARLLTYEGATRARLTFPTIPLPPQQGLGSAIGIWEGNAALAIAAARSLGAREHDLWSDAYLSHLHRAQMPSGCFSAREGGYPADRDPFFGHYLLQGGSEFAYLILGAYALGDRGLARSAMKGVQGLATDDDDPGFYYFTPTGLVGTSVRYGDEDDWPDYLYAQMGLENGSYYTAWEMGTTVAIAWATGAPERGELLRRFTGGVASPPAAITLLRSWGAGAAPSAQSGAPFDQRGALLGVLER